MNVNKAKTLRINLMTESKVTVNNNRIEKDNDFAFLSQQ